MAKTARVQARIEKDLRDEVLPILTNLGLSLTEAITLFLNQVRLQKGLPFPIKIPNEETNKVIKAADRGNNIKKFKNTKELFKDLGI